MNCALRPTRSCELQERVNNTKPPARVKQSVRISNFQFRHLHQTKGKLYLCICRIYLIMSISKSKIKKLFGKSKSLGKETRDADRTEGQRGTSPEDERASFRGSSMTLPSSHGDVTSSPDSLPTSPSEKKKKRFPTWRSKSRNKDKEFLRSSGEVDHVFNHK